MNCHAIITGGSSGIGKALAIQLAQQGYSISLMARTESTLQKACKEVSGYKINDNQQFSSFPLDVSNRDHVTQVFETAITRHGVPDVLITSAGIAVSGYFSEVSLDVHEQTMAVNYFGSLYCVKTVLPHMIEAQKGQIVLVSSGAGLVGLYGYTPYSPSKFALRGLAESMQKELKDQGIRVSIVYPPDTDTPQLVAEKKTKLKEICTKRYIRSFVRMGKKRHGRTQIWIEMLVSLEENCSPWRLKVNAHCYFIRQAWSLSRPFLDVFMPELSQCHSIFRTGSAQ